MPLNVDLNLVPLDVDLNVPASADDSDTNVELPIPSDPPRTPHQPAHDLTINHPVRRDGTIQLEGATLSRRGHSGASGSKTRQLSNGQRSDGGQGNGNGNNLGAIYGSESVAPPRRPRFICPVCLEEIAEPTATKCGHIFCRNCIFLVILHSGTPGTCPTCRGDIFWSETMRVFFPRVEFD